MLGGGGCEPESLLLGLGVALSSLLGGVEMHLEVSEARLMGFETGSGKVLSKQGNEREPNEITCPAGQRSGNVIGHPSTLDLEISSSHSSDDGLQVRRVVNELDNVGFGVSNGLPEASEMHISSVVVPDDPLVVDLVLVDGKVVSLVDRGGIPFFRNGLGARNQFLLVVGDDQT